MFIFIITHGKYTEFQYTNAQFQVLRHIQSCPTIIAFRQVIHKLIPEIKHPLKLRLYTKNTLLI